MRRTSRSGPVPRVTAIRQTSVQSSRFFERFRPTTSQFAKQRISPSSSLSVKMLNAKGTATEDAAASLVRNYAGIVLSSSAYSTLIEEYGAATVETLARATAEDKLIMGYTNPFTSATGFNFLVTLLDSASPGSILSDKATAGKIQQLTFDASTLESKIEWREQRPIPKV